MTSLFKKGTESRWSDEVHVVKEASGKTVTLTDGITNKRNKILMVPHNTVILPTAQLEKNVIKVATKQHKDKLYFKRESIDAANMIKGKRRTRNNQFQNVNHHQQGSEIEKPQKHKMQFLR